MDDTASRIRRANATGPPCALPSSRPSVPRRRPRRPRLRASAGASGTPLLLHRPTARRLPTGFPQVRSFTTGWEKIADFNLVALHQQVGCVRLRRKTESDLCRFGARFRIPIESRTGYGHVPCINLARQVDDLFNLFFFFAPSPLCSVMSIPTPAWPINSAFRPLFNRERRRLPARFAAACADGERRTGSHVPSHLRRD